MGATVQLRGASLCALALAASSAARAQDKLPPPGAPQDAAVPSALPTAAQGPEIIITGSRIPRRNLTAVSPVTTIKGEEFKLEGAVLTEDLINQLPQVTPDQGAFLSNSATGTSTVNLRDLGASRTLVLVNGRRLLPGDPTDPAGDINIIPSSIIQRVEILTGGASSVYGSDAVSGVINFILDTRIDGLRVDGQASFYQHDNRNDSGIRQLLIDAGYPFPKGNIVNGANRDINAAFGRGFLGGRGHVTIYGGYRKLSAITQDDRDYSSCTITTFVDDQSQPSDLFCGGSSVSAQGTFTTFFRRFHIGPNQTFVPGRTLYNFAPVNYYQRPGRRYTAGAFANVDLSDAIKPYLEVMFMDDRTIAQIAPSGDFANTFSVNCDNPLLSAQQLSLVCFNGNFVGQTPVFDDDGNLVRTEGSPTSFVDPVTGSNYRRGILLIGRRNVEGGPRRDDRQHKDLRVVGGIKGSLGRVIEYDASYLFGRVKFIEGYTNDASLMRITRALDVITDPATGQPVCRSVLTGEDPNCVPWNVFSLNAVTPEAAAYIVLPASQRALTEQKVANINATIQLGEWGIRSPWADEGPALNVGAEYRKDTLDFRPDAAFQSGDLTGQGQPTIPFTGSTTVKELFGEARVPLVSHHLVEQLAVEGGYRQSWHSDGASKFATGSYKLALDLTPIRGLRFRASQQRAVRAPNIQELFAPTFPDFFDIDPCGGISPKATQDECARTGVSAAQYGQILPNPLGEEAGYNAITGGNAALGPETALTRAAGVVLEPRFLPGFNATVDWFDIDLKGAIEQFGAQGVMNTCLATGDPLFCSRIHRDANGTLWQTPQGFIDNTNVNIGALNFRGIDISANYRKDLGRVGSVSVGMLGSYVLKWKIDNGGLSTPYDCAGLYGFACGTPLPHWRHTARLTWQKAGFSLSLNWRLIGKVDLDRSHKDVPRFSDAFHPSVAEIGAQSFFDLTALFRVNRDYLLRLGVRNIFDKEPPVRATGDAGACGFECNGNTYTQLYDPLGRTIFAGVTFNLNPRF
jgi:outer membrane receptor protein involved in Fe transport